MFIVLSYYFYRTFATLFISVLTDGAAEDAALSERDRRGGWVVDGGYAALVPCASGKGWIGGERFNGGLGVVCFHDFSFLFVVQSATHSARSAAISESGREKRRRAAVTSGLASDHSRSQRAKRRLRTESSTKPRSLRKVRISRTPVKQGRSVSCRGYNIRREGFAGSGETGRDFASLPPKMDTAVNP